LCGQALLPQVGQVVAYNLVVYFFRVTALSFLFKI
jgi:hypothetical protein